MKDQRTRQNTKRLLNDSSSRSPYKLPQSQLPPNDPHFYQQGTTHNLQEQLPTADQLLTSEHNKQIQTLRRASSQHQNYQQSTMDGPLPDLAEQSRLSTSILGTQTAPNSSPGKLDDNFGVNQQISDNTIHQRHARSDHESSAGDNHARSENHQVSEGRHYICTYPDCGKRFKQQGNLKTHERKHTGDRPYQCLFKGCGKTFAQMGNLQTHEKIHWLVKPYICDYPNCNRGFTQRGNLKAHLIKVHHVTPT